MVLLRLLLLLLLVLLVLRLACLHADAVDRVLGNVALDGSRDDGAAVVELVKVLDLDDNTGCRWRGCNTTRRTQLARQCFSNWARAATQGFGTGLSVVKSGSALLRQSK